ncbi:MAG: carboxypeptidase regulatory-like domain-containing protein [Sedimentisphaerales bacterium]|nr:carboxypeptidase regulatory-like domain-containing protein [Sedimentisphaerales bacterium]
MICFGDVAWCSQGAKRMVKSRLRKLILAFLAIFCSVSFVMAAVALIRFLPPERIEVTGRITDTSGSPLAGVRIRAVPVPVRQVGVEDAREVCDKRTVSATSDEQGAYHLKGLAGVCGWKESSYIQPYHITAAAAGYPEQVMDFQKPQRSKQRVIGGVDFVMTREAER